MGRQAAPAGQTPTASPTQPPPNNFGGALQYWRMVKDMQRGIMPTQLRQAQSPATAQPTPAQPVNTVQAPQFPTLQPPSVGKRQFDPFQDKKYFYGGQ